MFQIGYLIMLILVLWVISTIKNDAKNLEMKQIVAKSPYITLPQFHLKMLKVSLCNRLFHLNVFRFFTVEYKSNFCCACMRRKP
jgi:hypothetical protein